MLDDSRCQVSKSGIIAEAVLDWRIHKKISLKMANPLLTPAFTDFKAGNISKYRHFMI